MQEKKSFPKPGGKPVRQKHKQKYKTSVDEPSLTAVFIAMKTLLQATA